MMEEKNNMDHIMRKGSLFNYFEQQRRDQPEYLCSLIKQACTSAQ